jgi:autotransporter-associated beta strand protein
LGAITRNAGSTLDVPGGGVVLTSTGSANTLLTASAGAYATVDGGADWAAKNAANTAIVGYSTVASYSPTTPTALGGAGNNSDVSSGIDTTLASGASTSTLRFNQNEARTITVGASQTLTLTQGGILVTVAVNPGSGTTTITGGTIKPGSNNALQIMQNSPSGMTISSIIANNGATACPVTKSGSGTLTLTGPNTYTGATYVNQGALRLGNDTASGTTAGGITVQNNAALELANGVIVGAEALTLVGAGISNGGALRNVSGSTATYGGTITIGAGGARINSDSGASLTVNNASAVVTALYQDVTFGGAGNITVSGVISGAGRVIKDGAGTLTFSGAAANTYTGETLVNQGKLAITSTANAIPDAGTLRVASGAKVDLGSGVTETVKYLYLNGQPATAGTWGSTSSSATNKDNAHFSGTGVVNVTSTGSGTVYVIPSPAGAVILVR